MENVINESKVVKIKSHPNNVGGQFLSKNFLIPIIIALILGIIGTFFIGKIEGLDERLRQTEMAVVQIDTSIKGLVKLIEAEFNNFNKRNDLLRKDIDTLEEAIRNN